ncbi:MAG: hypothetical protein LLG04_12595 [Parachlamydia sp.]|nr:hypothetical protein [Parachlamydia sp.]
MQPLKKFLNKYHGEICVLPPEFVERPLTREQAIAQAHLPASGISSAAVPTPLSERRVSVSRDDRFGPFSQSFDMQKALEKATRACEAEKFALLQDATRSYESFSEQMTFWEVTSFWALAVSCSPFPFPMNLEVKHVNKIALLASKHLEADKIETISLIHAVGSLMANRQLKVKAPEATRTMEICSDKLLAELVFLFAQSLKPEEGKEWDADKLSFMALLVRQIDSAFDCSIYRIVDLLLVDSLKTCGMIEICMHLISQDASFASLRAFGHMMQYMEYEVPPGFHPSLWTCAKSLDLTPLDEEAIKDILEALFHGKQASLVEPVAFLRQWFDILCRAEYKNDVQYIFGLLSQSADYPSICSELEDKYKRCP